MSILAGRLQPKKPIFWRVYVDDTLPVAPRARFLNGFLIVIILFGLRQQEHVFVRLGRPVCHALRHRIRLVPDDVGAQIPAISLKREGDAPGDAEQIFRLCSVYVADPVFITHATVFYLIAGPESWRVMARVTIAKVKPKSPVVREYISDQTENPNKFCNVFLGSNF